MSYWLCNFSVNLIDHRAWVYKVCDKRNEKNICTWLRMVAFFFGGFPHSSPLCSSFHGLQGQNVITIILLA
jgi:hypothetical protein